MTKRDAHNRKLGIWGEQTARAYLEERGFAFISGNVRTPYGEIDLIMRKDGQTHFVEVKTRTSTRFGFPEDAVDAYKAVHLVDSAHSFLQEHPEYDTGWQIDVVAIWVKKDKGNPEIKYFENAIG